MTNYDAIIIGTGQAGPSLAGRLAGAGMKVAIIERKSFGGTCVNTGCIPTKAMVASAYAAHLAHRAADYGVVALAISTDMKAAMHIHPTLAELLPTIVGELKPVTTTAPNTSVVNA